MEMRCSRSEIVFKVFNAALLILLCIITIYPFWELIKVSFSNPLEVGRIGYRLWPLKTSLEGYIHVFKNEFIWIGYKNTIVRVILAVSVQMILTILIAYPLSKKSLPHRNVFTMLIVFTMFFSGGLIPEYLLVSNVLNIDNTVWSLVLPYAINTFGMLIMRNYFLSLPGELEESAKMDGAGELTVLIRIILPISMPILVTVALWGIVANWNAWFDCIIYIRDGGKYVLQAILRRIVIDSIPEFDGSGAIEKTVSVNAEIVKCSTIIVATLPVMLIYPFLQKYFIKGILIGSLKG